MAPKSSQLSETRTRLLQAAEELTTLHGPARLSLDAVAAQAGVSKGGLLYHFPSKNHLLRGMVQAHVDLMRSEMAARVPGGLRGPGTAQQKALAYLGLMRDLLLTKSSAPTGLLAAILEDADMVESLDEFRREVEQAFDGAAADGRKSRLIYLALEGINFGCITRQMEALDRAHYLEALEDLELILSAYDCPQIPDFSA
jgi:AcrR family transcriptional regulator